MSTLETQYKNYIKENPESAFTFEEWSDWKFSNMELPPPHNGLRPIEEYAEELSDWDVALMDGLENEPPYVSDDFQIGPDGAYEHIEYSIPIYENGIKTEYTVDGIVGDEKYYQLLELGNGKDLPDMINTTIKQTMMYPEIKCPYCRIQFGHYKIGGKVEHVDMLWTSAAGLIKECQNPELVKSNLESVDEYGNPKFNEDFQKKANELRNKFETCPDDITKENFNVDDYTIAFAECMNYGYVDGEDEEYDRENITIPKIQQLWENGHNLNESLKAFIIKNYE